MVIKTHDIILYFTFNLLIIPVHASKIRPE